jgi:hypothetical protein
MANSPRLLQAWLVSESGVWSSQRLLLDVCQSAMAARRDQPENAASRTIPLDMDGFSTLACHRSRGPSRNCPELGRLTVACEWIVPWSWPGARNPIAAGIHCRAIKSRRGGRDDAHVALSSGGS